MSADKINSNNPTYVYKSLSSMVRLVRGKRETWRDLFAHEEFKGHFLIEHSGTGGMKIKTKLDEKQLKTLFAIYKKYVSKNFQSQKTTKSKPTTITENNLLSNCVNV